MLETEFTVSTEKLKAISDHFASELTKGLTTQGGSIPMNPTWVVALPTGHETGSYLAVDLGGTNMRVCQVTLAEKQCEFEIIQSKYKIPDNLKVGNSHDFWEYQADCVQRFLQEHHPQPVKKKLPLGYTFSYPATQDYINHGILQRWTKGFDVKGVEGQNIIPLFEAALEKRNVPIAVVALLNDTTGTLVASAYADPKVRVGCIFGTGCNGAYVENCGSIPKLAHLNLPDDLPMVINCEWGAFDNERVILPRTPYDVIIDETSPRMGQQIYEKMVAGLYLGELWRLVALDLHGKGLIFKGQDTSKLEVSYSLDSSLLSVIEADNTENLQETKDIIQSQLGITSTDDELKVLRRVSELIGLRAARLTACGLAAISKKKGWKEFHVGADGSVFHKYPHFKKRQAAAMGEILGWSKNPDPNAENPIEVVAAQDGSGVGAALIAALTYERVRAGNTAGVHRPEIFFETGDPKKD